LKSEVGIETPNDFAAEFDMADLIFADWNKSGVPILL